MLLFSSQDIDVVSIVIFPLLKNTTFMILVISKHHYKIILILVISIVLLFLLLSNNNLLGFLFNSNSRYNWAVAAPNKSMWRFFIFQMDCQPLLKNVQFKQPFCWTYRAIMITEIICIACFVFINNNYKITIYWNK